MLDPVNDCQPAQRAATCRRSDTGSKIYLFICSMIQETNDLKIWKKELSDTRQTASVDICQTEYPNRRIPGFPVTW